MYRMGDEMKLIACEECKDTMQLVNSYTRTCWCGAVGGKYLDDSITAVVNKDAIVFGIDNYGFAVAKEMAMRNKNLPYRYDYFFSGWIPTKPGEVIVVETVEEVLEYPYELPVEERVYDSTWPSRVSEINLMKEKLKAKMSLKEIILTKIVNIVTKNEKKRQ